MNVTTLNGKIEKLAVQKADAHLRRMRDAISTACKDTGHERPGSYGVFLKKTFFEVLTNWMKSIESRENYKQPCSPELVEYYRAQILAEILEKLPLVKELCDMEE